MKITVNGNIVEIDGVIKTIENVEEIKNTVSSISSDMIILKIINSFAIPSSLIGYLIKLKQLDNKKITLQIGDEDLYELIRDLNLNRDFDIQKL